MKIGQRDSHKTPGSGSRHSKSLKKGKAVKKPPEKLFRGLISKDSRQLLLRQIDKHSHDESQSSPSLNVNGNSNIKGPPQLEKWKQEGGEWKTMKKIDYQRLETVLEEVQLSSEATCSKMNSEELGKGENKNAVPQTARDVGHTKPSLCNLMSQENTHEQQETQQHDQLIKRLPKRERDDRFDSEETLAEFSESVSKVVDIELSEKEESVILNKMMEILPIFSNDKFVCSRDAISVEESEDLEATDKHSGKTLFDGKNGRDGRAIDLKHLVSINCVKKTFCERLTDRLGDFKESTERKFRHKIIVDKNVTQATSSHFINFLLLLAPFAEEREVLLNQKNLVGNIITCKGSVPEENVIVRQAIQGDDCSTVRTLYFVILAVAALTSLILGLAWRSYKPPGFLDFIVCSVPFVHRRRTFIQRFFDNFLKIINRVYSNSCKNFSIF